MKRIKFLLLFIGILFFTPQIAQAQNVGGSYYLQYAVDGNGNRIENNKKRISVSLLNGWGAPLLIVNEYTTIGNPTIGYQELTMPTPLTPPNDSLQYAGVSNGWDVFTYHGFINVYIKGNTIRIERFNGNRSAGYAEYRK